MVTRISRRLGGRRRGEELARALIGELARSRVDLGLSQRALASALGRSQSELSRFERAVGIERVSVVEVAEVAALVGLELSAGLHPAGPPLRDKGHQALIGRLRSRISPSFAIAAEMPFPSPGDPRVWDLLLRLGDQRVGVEAETRIRDLQALSRRIHLRERGAGVDHILLVLSESVTNRRLVGELRESLGQRYDTAPRAILDGLGSGRPVPGSGVIIL